MSISLNEIAQHSGEALSQINWTLASIAIAVVGCWILAECIEVFEDRSERSTGSQGRSFEIPGIGPPGRRLVTRPEAQPKVRDFSCIRRATIPVCHEPRRRTIWPV
jgi:hypothetical protein